MVSLKSLKLHLIFVFPLNQVGFQSIFFPRQSYGGCRKMFSKSQSDPKHGKFHIPSGFWDISKPSYYWLSKIIVKDY